LPAKPIIDVLLTVADAERDAEFASQLIGAGYELRVREPGHRMFRTWERDVHVHVLADADPEVTRYLTLRDYLRRSSEARVQYAQLKRQLAQRDWDDMNDYADAKSELISALLRCARRVDVGAGRTADG
jgi:GrpB-like predicted nucleotidyltransferase (UPF0157 family)